MNLAIFHTHTVEYSWNRIQYLWYGLSNVHAVSIGTYTWNKGWRIRLQIRNGSALFWEAGFGSASALKWKLDPDSHYSKNSGALEA
jgi:hypothetical protein